jgi:putative flippase GtrA
MIGSEKLARTPKATEISAIDSHNCPRSDSSGEALMWLRYLINGIAATGAHFLVLTINVELIHFRFTGAANFVAAVFGSSVAFVGNRYYVFRKSHLPAVRQAAKFALLYISVASLHGAVLYVWSDIYRLDYRIGFVVATFLQVVLGYLGNKHLVFRV